MPICDIAIRCRLSAGRLDALDALKATRQESATRGAAAAVFDEIGPLERELARASGRQRAVSSARYRFGVPIARRLSYPHFVTRRRFLLSILLTSFRSAFGRARQAGQPVTTADRARRTE